MRQEQFSANNVLLTAEDGLVLRRRGKTMSPGNTAIVGVDAVDDWEEVTVEEAEASSRSAETEERYRRRVTERIRERYDLDAELAIQRQRDTKPEEFAQFNAYAEECKAAVRAEINAQYSLDDALNDDE